MTQTNEALVIGIAGGTGSGKTTIANNILARVGISNVAFLAHDNYYRNLDDLPRLKRDLANFDHPDALDNELFIEHVRTLKLGQPVEIPHYDFATHTRLESTTTVQPLPVLLVEGIMLLAIPELRDLLDVKIFVDADPDVRFIRRLERDISERGRTVDSVIEQYMATVRPGHEAFVEPSKRYADVIVPEGGYNIVAIEMLVARIQGLLPVAS